MKQIRIVLVGASPYNGNRGVCALTYSTLVLLHKIAKLNNCEINILLISTEYKKANDQLTIGNNNIKFVNAQPISVFSIKELLKLLIIPQSRKTLKELIKSDFVLNIGAGDSFSDIYGKNRFNSINNQHRMARLLNKKFALLPQTIGPYNDKNVQKQANKSIEKADVVFARDFQSFKYVTENTKQKNVVESIDVAFFMPYEKQKFSTDYIHVGINVSALLWHGGYNRNNQFGLKCNYQELIHDIIRYFFTLPNVKIHIVPHVVDQDASIENDYEVSYHLVNE
jgi:colanic acid/amylovoran biosynthesis protein